MISSLLLIPHHLPCCRVFADSSLTCISSLQNIKKSNPGISFTELGRVLGDKWNKMSGMWLFKILIKDPDVTLS